MLLDRFRAYLDKLFRNAPDKKEVRDLREELLGNLMSHAADLKGSDLSEDEIFEQCIAQLGDYSEAIGKYTKTPIEVIRDTRFQRSVLTVVSFILACVVLYIIIGFTTKHWGMAAYILFPTMAGLLYFAATLLVLRRNIGRRKHLTTFPILFSYAAIICTVLFFILGFGARLPLSVVWVVFPAIPVLGLIASILVFLLWMHKKVPLLLTLLTVIMTSVEIFLICGAATGLWHPLWIIIVVGIVASIAILILKLNQKIAQKEAQNKKGY